MRIRSLLMPACLAAAVIALQGPVASPPAQAQGGQQQWFVPGQQQQQQQQPQRPPQQQQQQQQRPPAQQQRPATQGQVPGPQEPGAPQLPPIPRGNPPPAAIIGVVGLPEVFEASVAARGVRQVVQERLARLNDEAQREQAAWRDAQQQLAGQRASLTPEQMRERERELQERIANGQRVLRERNAAIQQAGQRALSEVERTALYVIGQVAESRSLNLVLNRGALILAIDDLDITTAVVEQLNRALPSVRVEDEPGATPPAPPPQQRPAAQQQRPPPQQQQQQQQRPPAQQQRN